MKREWFQKIQHSFPKADMNVLSFISDFRFSVAPSEIIVHLFMKGYCYYFANMLKDAFERGMLCYAYPHDHIVWYDPISRLAYDINGVNANWKYLIRMEDMDDYILDFKHVPGKYSWTTDEEIERKFEEIIENAGYVEKGKNTVFSISKM